MRGALPNSPPTVACLIQPKVIDLILALVGVGYDSVARGVVGGVPLVGHSWIVDQNYSVCKGAVSRDNVVMSLSDPSSAAKSGDGPSS